MATVSRSVRVKKCGQDYWLHVVRNNGYVWGELLDWHTSEVVANLWFDDDEEDDDEGGWYNADDEDCLDAAQGVLDRMPPKGLLRKSSIISKGR